MSESWLPMDSELNRKDNCSAKGSQNYSRPKRAPSRHRLCGGSVIIATYRSRSRHRRLRDTNCRIVRNHQRLILPLNRGIGGPYCPRSRAAKALTWMPTTTVRCGEKLSRGSGRVGAKVREAATVPALDRRGSNCHSLHKPPRAANQKIIARSPQHSLAFISMAVQRQDLGS
jgi:hypothetical protein